MRLLRNFMGVLYNGLPHPKGETSAWAPNANKALTRYPCKVKLYHSYHATSKTARRFCDKIEWVRTYGYNETVIRSCKMQTEVKPNLYANIDAILEISMNGSIQRMKRC